MALPRRSERERSKSSFPAENSHIQLVAPQEPQTDSRMCIRVAGDAAEMLPRLRQEIAAVDGIGPKVAERIHRYLQDHPS